jgi:hypothetical protein
MNYRMFLIECGDLVSSGLILSTLEGLDENHLVEYINHNIICVDTRFNIDEIYDILAIKNKLLVGITEINDFNLGTTLFCYSPRIFEDVRDFTIDANISEDINYFLDLLVDRGGIDNLTIKEKERLSELSKIL